MTTGLRNRGATSLRRAIGSWVSTSCLGPSESASAPIHKGKPGGPLGVVLGSGRLVLHIPGCSGPGKSSLSPLMSEVWGKERDECKVPSLGSSESDVGTLGLPLECVPAGRVPRTVGLPRELSVRCRGRVSQRVLTPASPLTTIPASCPCIKGVEDPPAAALCRPSPNLLGSFWLVIALPDSSTFSALAPWFHPLGTLALKALGLNSVESRLACPATHQCPFDRRPQQMIKV